MRHKVKGIFKSEFITFEKESNDYGTVSTFPPRAPGICQPFRLPTDVSQLGGAFDAEARSGQCAINVSRVGIGIMYFISFS